MVVQLLVALAAAALAEDAPASPVDLGAAIDKRLGAIKACYGMGLEEKPGLEGFLRTRLEVAQEGRVDKVVLKDQLLDDDEVVRCALESLGRVHTEPLPKALLVTVELRFLGPSDTDPFGVEVKATHWSEPLVPEPGGTP